MTTEKFLTVLTTLSRRLASVADQARETREQAQHTLDRINRLRDDLEKLRVEILSRADTASHRPLESDGGQS